MDASSAHLEGRYIQDPFGGTSLKIGENMSFLDFKTMTQQDMSSGELKNVRRRPNYVIPALKGDKTHTSMRYVKL